MKFFRHIIALMKVRNEVLKSIRAKLKNIDKSLVCIAKEIRGLTNAIKEKR